MNVTIGIGAFIHSLNASARLVFSGFISTIVYHILYGSGTAPAIFRHQRGNQWVEASQYPSPLSLYGKGKGYL
jgi:hypothetical protein